MSTSTSFLLVPFVIFVILAILPSVIGDSDACDNTKPIKDIDTVITINNLREGAMEGQCWNLLPYDKNVAIISPDSQLFYIHNGSLVLNRNLFLDGPENQELCGYFKDEAPVVININYAGRTISVYVFLISKDDFNPEFNATSYKVHIRELNVENQAIMQFTDDFIEDDDCIRPRYVNFRIKNLQDSTSFHMTHGRIFVKSILDYEKQKEYLLTVELVGENKTTILTVFVDDVDDENPYFGSQAYFLNVTEETSFTNTWLLTEPPLWATDGDVGINETIEYSVLHSAINIQVNPTTGEVQIKSALDREESPEHTVTIKASQTNNKLRYATATLTIKVQDINDNLPEFSAIPHAPIEVMEGIPDGVLIIALLAEDKDEGENGQFSYELEDESGVFGIKMDEASKTEWLFVNNSAALNGTMIMKVKVLLKPKVEKVVGVLPCDFITTCVMELKVQVVDVNDHYPMFERAAYIFIIRTDSRLIGTILATDRDSGDNGNVTYTLELRADSQCPAVQIDPLSGVLSLAKPLSNNQSESCSLHIKACDNPSEVKDRKCSSVPVSIRETKSLNASYNVAIYEDIPIGSILLNLPDMDLIVKDRNFSIESGSLITNALIDREVVTFLEVLVYSSFDDSKHVSVVNVQILDINDNAPVFTHSVFKTKLKQNMNPGDKMIQIGAIDADDGDNAALTYSLLNGRDWFSIKGTTGFISIKKKPLFDDIEKISLDVQVTDGGSPALSSTAVVEVYNSLFNVTASLILPLSVSRVEKEKGDITKFLSDTLKYKVTIEHVETLPSGILNWSKLLISAKRRNEKSIERAVLKRMIKSYAAQIEQKYNRRTTENGGDEENEKFKIPFIIAVCIAAVLLLIFVISMIIVSRKLKRYRQNASILNKLNTDKAIYDNAGKQESPVSERINSSPKLHGARRDELPTQDTSSLTGFVNPASSRDEDEVDGERERELSTSEYADVIEQTSLRQNENISDFNENYTPDNTNEIGPSFRAAVIDTHEHGELSTPENANGIERTSLNPNENIGEFNENGTSDNINDIAPSSTAAIIDIHENGDIHADLINNRIPSKPARLYPNLPSAGGEEDDQSGTGSNTSVTSQDMQIDLGKNSDADSGVPSDKDGADNDDDDANSLEEDETFFGLGIKAKKDFDKPAHKKITLGLTDLEESISSEPIAIDKYKNPEEPEPDYSKKVRFEEFTGNNLMGNDTEVMTKEKTDDSNEDPNIKYFLETEITAL